MMTEAVGYISGRSELLCAAFFLLGFQAARAAILTGRAAWVAAALALWAGALASKETALMFPFLVFAYDRWVIGGAGAAVRPRWRVHARADARGARSGRGTNRRLRLDRARSRRRAFGRSSYGWSSMPCAST